MDWEDLQFDTSSEDASAETFNAKYYLPEAIDCMRCGVCLNACPTYHLFSDEAETPRSRVRSLDKVLKLEQSLTKEELHHLDNCLQCRACETVCPSKMQYGSLFDAARQRLIKPPTALAKIAFGLIEHKRWRFALMPLIWLYTRTGLASFINETGLVKPIGLQTAAELASVPSLTKLQRHYPAKTVQVKGKVGLFAGCLAEHFDSPTLTAAIDLLTAFGFDVYIPSEQSCCGAIHQHKGQSAQPFIDNNLAVFAGLDIDYVVYTATGCGAMLTEYSNHNKDTTATFGKKLIDINEFLLEYWPNGIKIKQMELKIAVHEPCSQRNMLKNQHSVYALLEKIPGIQVEPLSDNHLCCGAGGSYMLSHTVNAALLRSKKHDAIINAKADFVVSSNFGCILYLNNSSIRLLHTAQLLKSVLEI